MVVSGLLFPNGLSSSSLMQANQQLRRFSEGHFRLKMSVSGDAEIYLCEARHEECRRVEVARMTRASGSSWSGCA